ncbi:MAG: DNA polymerase III subunit beta [Bacteroides sp.]|nr:DNA polymerase III subunit beta [Bacteroides sp.]MBD5419201.1 DNA polymerase III subunit beta [Bacteroides sp.]
MRFNVSGKALQTQLQAVSKVISSKNAMSILDNFLFRIEGETLHIIGSDQENVMEATVEIMDVEGEGEIAVLAKRLLEIVKEISNQPLKFYINETTKEIDITFQNGHFNFTGIDAAEYPRRKPQEEDQVTMRLPGSIVVDGIEGTLFAASTDMIRPIMTGIYWDIEPAKITFVSSDTHKLVRYEINSVAPGLTDNFILPAKPAGILKNLINKEEGEVEIIKDDKSATFNFGTYSLSTRLIKGKYPDYKRVLPQGSPFQLVVNRESLLNAVRRVALFASKASQLVKFNISMTQILMGAQDLDYATSAEERVECDYKGNDMTIGFNSEYMLEVLANIKGDDVKIELSDPARPGLFSPLEQQEGEDVVMLQMPMQVIE